VDAANMFALKLYGATRTVAGNHISSPASARLAMTMATLGASGRTLAELTHVLELPDARADIQAAVAAERAEVQPSDISALLVANRLYAEQSAPLRADYLQTVERAFGVVPESVNFKSGAEPARLKINGWVASTTNQKITDLIPTGGLTPLTRVVIANAIYFKAPWLSPFAVSETKSDPFFINGAAAKPVATMHRTSSFRYAETPGAKMVELLYAGSPMAMTILLPNAKDGVSALESDLVAGKLQNALKSFNFREVSIALPKFKYSWNADLVSALRGMNLQVPFAAATADFSAMSDAKGDEKLYIANIFHKAYIDVNEVGTEAAAATAVVMAAKGMAMPQTPVPFVADHPFLYMIRNAQTGRIYFVGRVVDPSKG
jgi:serpin B